MQTTQSFHGHEVMHLLLEKGPMPRNEFCVYVKRLFGTDTQYHTCSASGMDIEALIALLLSQKKISEGPQGIFLESEDHICTNQG